VNNLFFLNKKTDGKLYFWKMKKKRKIKNSNGHKSWGGSDTYRYEKQKKENGKKLAKI